MRTYENGMQYQVILIDFSMPVMDGIEATTQIRRFLEQSGEETCIIGVTAHVQQELQQ